MSKSTSEPKARQEHLNKIDFNKLVDSEINKPGRYIGNELGVEIKPWESAKVRWALTYPEIYEVGASNLGHIILYSIINVLPGQLCDRAYLPGNDLSKKIRETSQKLFGIESHMPLITFDILGFSLSYELGATNILEMLDLSGIPIYSNERGNLSLNNSNSIPLVFAGGPTATSNPEPYAAFFDFFALGDGEELLPEIGLIIAEGKQNNLSRMELLIDLAQIPGVYVPSLYETENNGISIKPIDSFAPKRIIRRVAKPIPHYGMGLVPNIETIHDRLTIEIRRGCTRGCRFCQPGMLTRPARDVQPKEIIKAIENGMEKTGYSDFSLLSLSCSDYLALPGLGIELRNRLANKNVTLQLPSQRIDRFNDDIAHILGGTRKTSLTFAPEAGTQKLRDIVNKGLTNKDLLEGIRNAMRNGHYKIKLYFMIGLPGEDDDDVIGIAETCKYLKDKCIDLGYLRLNITISNFTPKPHTPFQWHSVSTEKLIRKQQLLRYSFKKIKGIKVNYTDVRISAMEDFIGRGDRRLAKVIESAWKEGAGMDAWFESIEKAEKAWKKAITLFGLEGNYRELEMGNWQKVTSLKKNDLIAKCSLSLPWDHIDTGIDKKWLAIDLQKALDQKVVPDCSFNECSGCGVCGDEMGHNEIVEPIKIPKKEIQSKPNSNKICRIRFHFSKTGYMKYISHLDIIRLLDRALRRMDLPISFTGGFHPLPRINIALALPLGVEGFNEIMDMDFTELVDPKDVLIKLQSSLPNGLKLLDANSIPIQSCNLSQELDSATWEFEITSTSLNSKSSIDWDKAINNLIKKETLIWNDQDKKGRNRARDFKEFLTSLQIKQPSSNEQAPIQANTIGFKLESHIDKSGRCLKPRQIHYWLEEYLHQPLKITGIKRTELKLLSAKVNEGA